MIHNGLIYQQFERHLPFQDRLLFKLVAKVFLLIVLLTLTVSNSLAVEFSKKTYPNGLTLIHVERKTIPAISVSLIMTASTLQETPDKSGLANLTAKMLLEGTKKTSAKKLSEKIDFLGATVSASASYDYTTLTMNLLKRDKEEMFGLFSEILLQPAFEEKEFQRIRQQIKGALKQREEEPAFLAEKEFRKLVFKDHPYGRIIEGSQEGLDRITLEDLKQFYKANYTPAGAFITIVGDISFKEADELVSKHLSSWEGVDLKGHRDIMPKVPEPTKQVSIIDKDLTQANIIVGHLGVERSNPDFYALSVMNYILGGGGFASRLMKVVRDDLGLTYGISSHFSMSIDKGYFEVEVQTKNDSAGEVVKEIVNQLRLMQKEPVSDQELADAKSFLIGSFPRRLETNRKIADFMSLVQYYRLGDDYLKKYPEYIQSVTKEDLLRVARKYLHPDRYTLVITGKRDAIKLNIP